MNFSGLFNSAGIYYFQLLPLNSNERSPESKIDVNSNAFAVLFDRNGMLRWSNNFTKICSTIQKNRFD